LGKAITPLNRTVYEGFFFLDPLPKNGNFLQFSRSNGHERTDANNKFSKKDKSMQN
jgi:hypothetical protein